MTLKLRCPKLYWSDLKLVWVVVWITMLPVTDRLGKIRLLPGARPKKLTQ